jgi:hypothetical protein
VSHSGVNDVKCHTKGKKHKQLEHNLKSGKQLTLHFFKTPNTGHQDNANAASNSKPSNLSGDEYYNNRSSTSSAPSSSTADLTKPSEPQESLGLGQEPHKAISSFLFTDTVTKTEVLRAAFCVSTLIKLQITDLLQFV